MKEKSIKQPTQQEIDSITPMIYNMIRRKFYWFTSKHYDLKKDLVQVAYLAFFRAYPLYDETKSKLSTYMYRVMFRDMLKFACDWSGYEGGKRNFNARQPDLSIQALTDSMYGDEESRDEGKNSFLSVEEEHYLSFELSCILHQVLTDREYMVISSMYFYGLKQKEIAKALKITPQAVSFQHMSAINKLKLVLNSN